MTEELTAGADEIRILRELAKKQLEYANLPVMAERTQRWYDHNALRDGLPMVVMETGTFQGHIMPEPKCESPAARSLESRMVTQIVNHELVDDDKVVPAYVAVNSQVGISLFDLPVRHHFADDGRGSTLGRTWDHPITNLAEDMHKLKPSLHHINREATLAAKTFAEDAVGDILPVKVENGSLDWFFAPTAHLIPLMGMEYMLVAMLDSPEKFHEIMSRVCDELLAFARRQEEDGLLTLNNGNHYVGSGSYGFTTELPGEECRKTGKVTMKDLWMNSNSQESVGISPGMYEEFMFPHYRRLAAESGLFYYGCCEPVHEIWDGCVSRYPNLRKVSVSPWCDEAFMGERLRDSHVIYSRKPSPNYIGVGDFDEDGYRKSIAATLAAAQGCTLEIIHRDIYSLCGDRTRAGRAIAIAREVIDEMWG